MGWDVVWQPGHVAEDGNVGVVTTSLMVFEMDGRPVVVTDISSFRMT